LAGAEFCGGSGGDERREGEEGPEHVDESMGWGWGLREERG
jgi:hypothetical protein